MPFIQGTLCGVQGDLRTHAMYNTQLQVSRSLQSVTSQPARRVSSSLVPGLIDPASLQLFCDSADPRSGKVFHTLRIWSD